MTNKKLINQVAQDLVEHTFNELEDSALEYLLRNIQSEVWLAVEMSELTNTYINRKLVEREVIIHIDLVIANTYL